MHPIGRTIGKYEIVRVIGSGGFGTVYEGRDPFIKRRVAVKTCSTGGPEVRDRFFREAEIAGNLHHRNIVTVHDFGVQDEIPYLVQEYLEGEDLNALIAAGRVEADSDKVDILLQVARGLAHAHGRGVIHRDVKPANIRILPDGTVKIMDFGIAKLADVESNLTRTGMTLGTAAFLAPEQIKGLPIDQRVDQFAFGVLAYELVCGKRPFRGRTISALFSQILEQNPEPLRNLVPACPPALDAIILQCLAKDAASRFASMQVVEEQLLRVRDELRPTLQIRRREHETKSEAKVTGEVVQTLSSDETTTPNPPTISPEQILAEADRALERGQIEDAAALLVVLEKRGGISAAGLLARRRRLDQLRREERDARVRDCLTRARGLLAIDQLEAALVELERAVELNPLDEALTRLRDQVREQAGPAGPVPFEEQRRVAEKAADRGDWLAAEAALRAAEHRHGRAAVGTERSRIDTLRGMSLPDQLELEVARAEGLMRDGDLRQAFDRLRAVLEIAPSHAGAQALLERARLAVAEPHERLTGEAALLEVSRIISAGSLPSLAPRRSATSDRLLIALLVVSLCILAAAILVVAGFGA